MGAKKIEIDEKQIEAWIERGVKKLENLDCGEKKGWRRRSGSGAAGTIWFLGFVGALFFYFQQVTTFGSGVVALLKALVWPGFLIYNLMDFLKVGL